jgi:hypothetical protein
LFSSVALSPSQLFSLVLSNPSGEAKQLALSGARAARASVQHRAEVQREQHTRGRSLENQQWQNMFFFINDSKLMIFLLFFVRGSLGIREGEENKGFEWMFYFL